MYIILWDILIQFVIDDYVTLKTCIHIKIETKSLIISVVDKKTKE